MKKLTTLLAICFIFSALFGQKNGYKISIETKNLQGECIYMCLYEGNYKTTYIIDSVKITKNLQTAVFAKDKKVIPAVYQLRFRNKNDKRDIMIDNGNAIALKIDSKTMDGLSTADPLNKDFLASQNNMNPNERAEIFAAMEKKFPQNSLLKLFALIENRKQDRNFANKFPEETRRQEYFKGIDPDDKKIRLLPNFYQFLNTYTSLFPIDKDNYKKNVDFLLKGQNCESRNYLFYTDWFFKNLEFYSTNKDFLDMYRYVFDTYMNQTKCMEKDQKLYSKALTKIRSTEALPIGAVLPEIKLKNTEKKEIDLKDIYTSNLLTVIAFYDPDCVHCQTDVPKMVELFDKMDANWSSKINKVAFFNASQNEKKWNDFINQKNLKNWTNVEGKDSSVSMKFGFAANPSYLVINKKGEVISKKLDEKEIVKYLEETDKE